MKKKILFILGFIAIVYVVFRVGRIVYYSHNTKHLPKTYLWLFNDSIKNNLDTLVCIGHSRESDSYYHYMYKGKTAISIFEYKRLNFMDIDRVKYNYGINLNNFFDDFSGEAYNMKLYPCPETSINFILSFNNSFNVNLDSLSTIDKPIKGLNYQGFLGHIQKMSFSNSEGKHLVLFDYKYCPTKTLFIIYKHKEKFIVILINSEVDFDEKIINIT